MKNSTYHVGNLTISGPQKQALALAFDYFKALDDTTPRRRKVRSAAKRKTKTKNKKRKYTKKSAFWAKNKD